MSSIVRIAKDRVLDAVSIRRLPRGPKAALLTFDDGPDREVTPRVLELLSKYSARGVFFVVGSRIPRAPHLLKDIVAAGHVIGNHTFAHRARGMSIKGYFKDIQRCQAEIEAVPGIASTLFRPPEGRVWAGSLVACWRLNLRTVLWNCNTRDWMLTTAAAAEDRAAHMLEELERSDGNPIILMHDDNPYCPGVLAKLLDWLASRNYDLSGGIEVVCGSGPRTRASSTG